MSARNIGGPLPAGQLRPMTDTERVLDQIERGEVRTGPDAAREIAARIEAAGGFWDHPDYRTRDGRT